MQTPSRALRAIVAVTLTATALAATSWLSDVMTAPASAASTVTFDPGLIISDAVFFDTSTMSAAAVQDFLASQGAACQVASDGTPCLKDYRQTTTSRLADTRCAAYTGTADERASDIITKVALACGINPQVLIATLQKEQSLVNRKVAGTAAVYQKAMGYGCPDTAVCDVKYYGFFNQVYSAAWQFKNYTLNPTKFAHIAGAVNNIQLNPDPSCGTTAVLIQNQATVNLYNYTPYQPNAAALAAGYGTGDGCSSYGNRNFWNYFNDSFGPSVNRAPVGNVEQVADGVGQVVVSGWARDPDTDGPIAVHVYVDGASQAWSANLARPDVGAHGFTGTIAVGAGSHTVCVYAMDATGGLNSVLGCRSVNIAPVINHAPVGNVEQAAVVGGQVVVSGWARDPDTDAPIAVHVYVDGAGQAWSANLARPDVGAHGFAGTIAVGPGSHTVCVYGIDATGGLNSTLACQTVS
jgi:hypothetical protein